MVSQARWLAASKRGIEATAGHPSASRRIRPRDFVNSMRATSSRLSEQYLAALRKHLKPGSKASLRPAARLGRRAVALGLETLDLAKMHEQALAASATPEKSSSVRERGAKRAKAFFSEASAPIEGTHRASVQTGLRVHQLGQSLRQRTAESSASARQLQRGIAQRRAAEAALKRSAKHCAKLLDESHRLQAHLRHLTHDILSAQEAERQKISRQLHDEIAQTLLAINVRLLTLKRAARANTRDLKKEIASTHRLVEESVRSINRFAHEFGLHHET